MARSTFWGFRVHALMAWPGVLVRLCIAPANQQELDVLPELARGQGGTVLGDRNYWSPKKRQLLASEGAALRAPFRNKKHDPRPKTSARMSRLRYRIDTVFGQMCERFAVKQVEARDSWHLVSRLLRVALAATGVRNAALPARADGARQPLPDSKRDSAAYRACRYDRGRRAGWRPDHRSTEDPDPLAG